jgi:glycosyltransferase involved in cell wall biosynthesis
MTDMTGQPEGRDSSSVKGPRAPTVWICSYLPHSSGAGVERFVDMISDMVRRSGRTPKILDLSSVMPSESRLRKIRYLVAWKIGREVSRRAGPSDIVVCNNFFSWNAPRKRSMVVYHGTDRGRSIKNRKNMSTFRHLAVRTVGSFLEKRTGKGRFVIAVSNSAKEEVEAYYGLKVQGVIPNAVDLSLFSPAPDRARLRAEFGLPEDKFLILFVGTSDPRKGLGWIIREIGPKLGKDQHLVLRTDMTDPPAGVTLLKRMPIERLADLYRACDVLLFPTAYEGCSFSLVEALASGLPVITSPAGSGRDLGEVDTLRPYIIDGNDAEKYVECLSRLQASDEEWARVSAAVRRFAEEHHGLSGFEKKYLEVINGLSG